MRVLVVEDDDRISNFLVRALKSEGHNCVRSNNGRDALELAKNADFDLILLDLMLPNISGLNVCQELRIRNITTPIIILTAMDGIEDIITGLKMGADDYMTKPFVIDELFARIEAVCRRGTLKQTDQNSNLVAGNIVMDREAMSVRVNDEPIALTAKEFAVLELLMAQPGRMYSRERILSNIWGVDKDPLTNVVDVYVGRVRRKLNQNNNEASCIETVRGMGYRLSGRYR